MNNKKSKASDEVLTIRINLQNNNPVLHEFAYPEDKVLNPAVEEYIIKQAAHLNRKRFVEIEVLAKEEDVPVFKKALDNTFKQKIDNAKKDILKKRLLAFAMLILGALFLGIGFLLNGQKIFYEIFLVASWVFLWRAAELLFFEIQAVIISAYKYAKILNVDIKITIKD